MKTRKPKTKKPSVKETRRTVSIYMPKELVAKLRTLAKNDGRSLSSFIYYQMMKLTQ